MKSIKERYRIGHGPSSNHTMDPRFAAEMFLEKNRAASSFKETSYGSLAATSKGHMKDEEILDVLRPVAPVDMIWKSEIFLSFHPNGMRFCSYDGEGREMDNWTVFSVGGSALIDKKRQIAAPLFPESIP